MNQRFKKFLRSLARILIALILLCAIVAGSWFLWHPGLDIRDGSHDRGSNAVWIAHGWLGADDWFIRNGKTNQFHQYRDRENIRTLAQKFRQHGITDVFPHLCPSQPDGQLAARDRAQVEKFLDEFNGFRVMPWVGGPNGSGAQLDESLWRIRFVKNVRVLLTQHPRLAGIHLNIEPLPSGDKNFLLLLSELHAALPPGKILSVAAYPPPTRWHKFSDVHWDEAYFREVAKHSDQLAVMMYDAGQKIPKTYQKLMSDWTGEVLSWSEGKPVLLGVPAYDDAGTEYHNPQVENITNALPGIHRGLAKQQMPTNYQGIAIYCDWETTPEEWQHLREHFLRPSK
ncbi:MAG: hypothetical protein JWM68_2277 [Verrucomicrobiales bacterium]|nr:hypothetical protein [Verrucomicrobiales bacterium]